MINRILDFSEAPARLRVRVAQLVVLREDRPEVSVPLADLAVVVVAHPQVTYTQAVLSGLAEAGGVFVACDGHNLPVGMLLPLAAHFAQAERFAAQARAPLPVRKRLWRQIVRAKIEAQAALLVELRGMDFGLKALVSHVHSGDPSNVEARAARRYWPQVFADLDFRRHRENEDQNILLNYGYAVLRAIVARAICTAGLHPSGSVRQGAHIGFQGCLWNW
ncbi:MAG: type II CRISPR-associated endonuclease Cas1 [Planctomycetaceae bacterium]|nr:type II CRISPR-associated endonuclease Cas1 [Planctomycetaceae bacterium]